MKEVFNQMKIYRLNATLLMLVMCALSSIATSANAAERSVSHNLELTDPNKPAKIDVSLMSGKITVEGYKGKTVKIQATVNDLDKVKEDSWGVNVNTHVNTKIHGDAGENRPSTKGLKRVKKTNVNIDIEERNNRVSIESHNNRDSIELILKVPFNASLELEVNKGQGVSVTNVYGEIEIESVRGPITAKGVRGSIVAESSRSDMTIVFDEFNLEKPSSLTVHRGNIDVTLPSKASALIDVKNYDGEIFSGIAAEFKNVDKVEKGKSKGHQKITIGGSMQANLNGGKQKLLLNTFRGDMFIRSK